MEFKYRDQVVFTSGFHKDARGVVIDKRGQKYVVQIHAQIHGAIQVETSATHIEKV